jgi:hypothetical protein
VTVDVYAEADEVELCRDGAVLARTAIGTQLPLVARFETEYHPGVLTAVAYTEGAEVGRTSLRTAGLPVLVARAERAEIATNGTLGYVVITIEDAEGTVVCDADRLVTVEVSGGELAGIGSGRARTEESFAGPSCTTYDGRLVAIVRRTGPGEIRVTASATGFEPAVTVITAR